MGRLARQHSFACFAVLVTVPKLAFPTHCVRARARLLCSLPLSLAPPLHCWPAHCITARLPRSARCLTVISEECKTGGKKGKKKLPDRTAKNITFFFPPSGKVKAGSRDVTRPRISGFVLTAALLSEHPGCRKTSRDFGVKWLLGVERVSQCCRPGNKTRMHRYKSLSAQSAHTQPGRRIQTNTRRKIR